MTDTPSLLNCSPMDTQIFNQGLSVEATSAYIIITAFVSEGVRPLMESIQGRWNAPAQALPIALAELEALNIVECLPAIGNEGPMCIVNPASLWGTQKKWPEPKPLPVNPRPK